MYAYIYLEKGHVPHTHTHTHTHTPTHPHCLLCIYLFKFMSINLLIYLYIHVYVRTVSLDFLARLRNDSGALLYIFVQQPCVTWPIHICDMTHSYVWHDSFICETWLIHRPSPCSPLRPCTTALRDMTHSSSYVWHDAFICTTWLIHMCDIIHSCVWQYSLIRATWLIHTCDMAHSHVRYDLHIELPAKLLDYFLQRNKSNINYSSVRHDSFTCTIWLIHLCNMTHSYVRHDSFIGAISLIKNCEMTHSSQRHDSLICVTWLIYMCDVTYS